MPHSRRVRRPPIAAIAATILPLLVVVAAASCARDGPPNEQESAEVADSAASAERAPGQSQDRASPSTGQELFGRIGCNGCHTVDGVGGIVGPDLSAVGARPSRDSARWPSTEAYIRASLERPGEYFVEGYTPDMPSPDQLGIGPDDIDHLVAYLLTLRSE